MSLTKSLVAGATFAAALTAAVFTVCVHFEASGGVHLCRDACTPAVVKEYGIKYGLGVQSIDTFLCHLDAFFRASLESPVLEFTQLFLLSVPVSVFVLLIESMRDDKPLVGFVPLLFTILLQTISGALGGTLFWMPFVVQACFGGSRQAKKTLNQVDVEAALIATVGGYLAPTAWMFLTKDSLAILVWQFFPHLSVYSSKWMEILQEERAAPTRFRPAPTLSIHPLWRWNHLLVLYPQTTYLKLHPHGHLQLGSILEHSRPLDGNPPLCGIAYSAIRCAMDVWICHPCRSVPHGHHKGGSFRHSDYSTLYPSLWSWCRHRGTMDVQRDAAPY